MKKILKYVGFTVGVIAIFCAGAASSFYAFTALEFNDRLKYEVVYLRSHVGVLRKIHENDIDGAKMNLDALIDSYASTLFEFRYFENSITSYEIDQALCKAVALRKEYPRHSEDSQKTESIESWYKDIDGYLEEMGHEC